MDRKKGLAEELLAQGARLAVEAAEKVLSDPRGRDALSLASELAQKAVKKLEELPSAAARAAGVPGSAEVRDLEERLARVQRKAEELQARLDAAEKGERRTAPPAAGGAAKEKWKGDPEDPDLR